jgi:DnaJ-class molecular chaperone
VILHCHVSKLDLESVDSVRALQASVSVECPHCKGSGHVPMQGGLRQKDCLRCQGRGWFQAGTSTMKRRPRRGRRGRVVLAASFMGTI